MLKNGVYFRLQVIRILSTVYVDSVAIVMGVYLLTLNLVDCSWGFGTGSSFDGCSMGRVHGTSIQTDPAGIIFMEWPAIV